MEQNQGIDHGNHVLLLAYLLCHISWLVALLKKLSAIFEFIFFVVLVLVLGIGTIIVVGKYCILPFWLIVGVVVLLGIVACVIVFFKCKRRLNSWFLAVEEMSNKLFDSNNIKFYLEFDKETEDKVMNFINHYRYDNWTNKGETTNK